MRRPLFSILVFFQCVSMVTSVSARASYPEVSLSITERDALLLKNMGINVDGIPIIPEPVICDNVMSLTERLSPQACDYALKVVESLVEDPLAAKTILEKLSELPGLAKQVTDSNIQPLFREFAIGADLITAYRGDPSVALAITEKHRGYVEALKAQIEEKRQLSKSLEERIALIDFIPLTMNEKLLSEKYSDERKRSLEPFLKDLTIASDMLQVRLAMLKHLIEVDSTLIVKADLTLKGLRKNSF